MTRQRERKEEKEQFRQYSEGGEGENPCQDREEKRKVKTRTDKVGGKKGKTVARVITRSSDSPLELWRGLRNDTLTQLLRS